MRAGDLKNRVVLEAQSRTPDGMGGFSSTWIAVKTIYAAIWPMKMDEAFEGGRTVAVATHRIRIRYRRVLKPAWRVRFGTKYFSIVSIINPGTEYKMLDLMCKEVV